MKTETIVMCIVALILGMLMANMLKDVCGCNVVEGSFVNSATNFVEKHPRVVIFPVTLPSADASDVVNKEVVNPLITKRGGDKSDEQTGDTATSTLLDNLGETAFDNIPDLFG